MSEVEDSAPKQNEPAIGAANRENKPDMPAGARAYDRPQRFRLSTLHIVIGAILFLVAVALLVQSIY